MTRLLALAILFALATCAPAVFAIDNGQWGDQPPEVRAWFKSLKVPGTNQSCCGEADAYQADSYEVEGDHYVAIVTDGSGDPSHGRPDIPTGTRVPVPNDRMVWTQGNPTGHGIVFLRRDDDQDGLYAICYIVPGGV
jgi:hypothetical protein